MSVRWYCWCVPLLLASCDGGGLVGDPITGVTVYGRVATASQQPVPGAQVAGVGRRGDGCQRAVAGGPPDTTDALGDYSVRLETLGLDFVGCVELFVMPPAGAGLRADTTRVFGVQFLEFPGLDSVRVDVVLMAGA